MTNSRDMTPGWYVRNVDAKHGEIWVAALRRAGLRLGISAETEELTLDGRLLTFRTAEGSVTRRMSSRINSKDVGVAEIETAVASMRRDVAAVRLLRRNVVASNLAVDEMSARAFFHMGGSAASIRTALLNTSRDPSDEKITLRRDSDVEVTLSFQHPGHYGPGCYILTSFVLPGVATMTYRNDGMVIHPAKRLTGAQQDAIGQGQGLSRVLGHELFDVFPFAVTGIDATTGAIKALRRPERRLARIEKQHQSLDAGFGGDSCYTDIDTIEMEMRDMAQWTMQTDDRSAHVGTTPEESAKRAFLHAMEIGIDPWADVARSVLEAVERKAEVGTRRPTPPTDWRSVPVEHLKLDMRARNCVLACDVRKVGELDAMTDGQFLRIPNLGHRSLAEIRAAISALQTSM